MRTGDPRQRFQTDGMQSISPQRLVILLYERAGRDLNEAREAISTGDSEARHRTLMHAQEIIAELSYAVRPDVWLGGEGLLAIYDYLLELLVKANIEADLRPLDDARALVADLTTAWRDAYLSIQVETATA